MRNFLTAICFLFIFFITLFSLSQFIQTKEKIIKNSVAVTSPSPSVEPTIGSELRVPILMYHYIRNAPQNDQGGVKLSVSPDNLERQLHWLAEQNYQSTSLEKLADYSSGKIVEMVAPDKKPVIITFDDGYADAYTNAFPILKKYQFTATFFIIRNDVGKKNYLSAGQIDELKNAGMEIGSHTLSHVDLSRSLPNQARQQIFDSKQEAKVFCYPSGRFNSTAVNLVKEAGYLAAVTTVEAVATSKSNLYEIPRLRVTNMSIDNFAKMVSQ